VAFPTKCDEVRFHVVTEGAAPSHVVDIEIPEGSAFLTTPTVAFQDHATQRPIKPQRRLNSLSFLRRRVIHLASSLTKPSAPSLQVNHRQSFGHPIFGSDLPVSKAAPARKSAQIISRQ
jgi:hypothetical protein